MIYLVGINHSFQVRTKERVSLEQSISLCQNFETACRFEKYLQKLVDQITPEAICEEYNEECLFVYGNGAYSIAKNVCDNHKIQHIFCDPNRQERDELYVANGTTEDEDEKNCFPIRENEWLRRINISLPPDASMLFICGAIHISTFKKRLINTNALTVEVICRDFELDYPY